MSSAAKRLISVLASFGFIIGAGIVFFSLIIPSSQSIQQLRGERSSIKALVEEERATIESAERLLSRYEDISNLQENLSLALPPSERIPGVVNQLQGITKTTGVLIESLDIQILPIRSDAKGQVANPIGTIQVTMTVKGTYEGIKAYIEAVQTNIRVMDVNSLRVEDGADKDVLTYTLVVDTYYQQ